MRSFALRLAATLAVCAVAVSFTGCGSNNTGKIVGKWKMVSSSKPSADFDELKKAGVAMAFDYKEDGTFSVEFVPNDDKPESKLATEMANTGLKGKEFSGKYSLGAGDRVTYTGAKDMFSGKKAASNVTINGDSMTMKDDDGTTMQLTRIK